MLTHCRALHLESVSSCTSFTVVLNEITYRVGGRRAGSTGRPRKPRQPQRTPGVHHKPVCEMIFHRGPTAKDWQNHYLQPVNRWGKSLRPTGLHELKGLHIRLKILKKQLTEGGIRVWGFLLTGGSEAPLALKEAKMLGYYGGKNKASCIANTIQGLA